MVTKVPGRSGRVRAVFVLPSAIWADTIHVVGDFNDWDQHATPLRLTDNGWVATIELDPGQSYQYRYLINGTEWHNDWQADRYEPNQYGGDNSVIVTPYLFEEVRAVGEVEIEQTVLPASTSTSKLRLVRIG